MRTSSYFNRTLFYHATPAIDQLFEDRASGLFEVDNAKSSVDVHVCSHETSETTVTGSRGATTESESDVGCETPTEPGFSVDRTRYPHDPPGYVSLPGLHLHSVAKPDRLQEILSLPDQPIRICFIRQRNSYSRLQLTRELYDTLINQFRIYPRFVEFILLFGARSTEYEIRPPQLHFRQIEGDCGKLAQETCAGFECAYGLRYVELNHRQTTEPWSIRQTVVYHKFITETQSSTWLMIAPSESTQLQWDRYLKSFRDISKTNPFEFHVILLDTALANWRPYVISLTQRITRESDRLVVADVDAEGPLSLKIEQRQTFKDIEDYIIDALVALDSTSETVHAMVQDYRQFCLSYGNTHSANRNESDPVSLALLEKQREISSSRKKIEALQRKVEGSISLVKQPRNCEVGSETNQDASNSSCQVS
ncbi:hypothetical protein MMC30_007400 [Trapelia coarctata]|nr:hypothetical protein [Trapelia coarctata]